MITKGELVSKIEGLLGARLGSLDRMTKVDLERLYSILREPRSLLNIGMRSRRGEIERIGRSLGLPKPPAKLGEIGDILGDPLKGLALLLELREGLARLKPRRPTPRAPRRA